MVLNAMADMRETLLLPFDKGLLAPPANGSKWIVLNSRPLPLPAAAWHDNLCHQQGFRPDYLALAAQRSDASPDLKGDAILSGALVLLTRSRALNEANIATAWNRVSNGSSIVVAGDNKIGIRPLQRWVEGRADIAGSLSKYHARVFWLTKIGANWPTESLVHAADGYEIAPGMFSMDGPDAGSVLLAEQFDNRISGRVADLGAGWGYLSNELLQRADLESIDLFEADHASLEAARQNVKPSGGTDLRFHWHDVVGEPIGDRFDTVIMNPPFHIGRSTDPDLGRAFIRAAATILVKGGRLLMVANIHLPYEQDLKGQFRTVSQIAQRDGFKIIEAIR